MLRVTSFGALAPGKDRSNDNVRRKYLLLDGVYRRVPGTNATFKQFIQLAKSGDGAIENCDLGTEAGCHSCRMRAHDAASDHDDTDRLDTRHAAE